MKKIDCGKCPEMHHCCQFGAWVDLDKAKRIVDLNLKGDFFHLEKDAEAPSGYSVGTSVEDEKCTFLDDDGLCSIHKVDFSLKPEACKEFPYEGKVLSEYVDVLCLLHKKNAEKAKKPNKRNKDTKKRKEKK